jgi:hypothetical protein
MATQNKRATESTVNSSKKDTPMSTCYFDAEVADIETTAKRIAEMSIFPLNKFNSYHPQRQRLSHPICQQRSKPPPNSDAFHKITFDASAAEQRKIHSHCEIVFDV